MINNLMKWLLVVCLLTLTVSAKDTISFDIKEQPKLYNSSYSYSYKESDRDWDYKDYDREHKYNYGNPSIPEPSTWSLFAGLCALSAAFIWRFKKRSV